MPKRSFYVKDSELDDYQVKIINKRTDNSFIVKGCAGSGKSILALWKAKQIQDEDRGNFLFVVFTKALKQYMKDGIKQINLDSDCVENYNQCLSWRKTESGRWESNGWKKGSYDYIIVDEAQDFPEDAIRMFKSNARKALLLYGDSAQQLYKSKNAISMDKMALITGFPTEQLVFNHRLPKKIARFAQYISGTSDDLEGRCTNEGVEEPHIIETYSFSEQMDKIVDLVKNRHFEDVGILCRHNTDVEKTANYLRNHGLPNVEAKVNDNMDLDFSSDNPKVMTYHSAKGLQFEAVFLPECTCEDEDYRNALYVALTRTYQSLYILHSGNLSSFFDEIPTDYYETLSNETDEL